MHLPPRHAKPVLSGGSLLELTSSLNYFPPLAIQILPVSHTRPTHSTSTGSSSQQCCLSVIHTANNFRVFIMSQVDSTTVTAHECRDGQRACFLAPIPPRILQSLSFFFSQRCFYDLISLQFSTFFWQTTQDAPVLK